MAPGPEDPTPVEPTPEEPTPGTPAPVEPAPVEPAPVEPAPVEPAPVEPDPAAELFEQPPVAAPLPPYGSPEAEAAAAAAKPGLSTGAGIGIGAGIGCGAHVIALILMIVTGFAGWGATFLGLTWPFILVALAAIVMLFFTKTRGIAIGVLIVAAAVWIVFLGPCIGLLGV